MRKFIKNHYLQPRYWPIWLVVGMLWVVTKLPYRWQIATGKLLGQLIFVFAKKMRRISTLNLQMCFPELSEQERTTLLKQNFEAVGIGMIESALAAFASDEQLRSLGHVHGLEHVHTALADGKGAILVGTHFSTLQIIGRLMMLEIPIAVVYRKQKNPLLNWLTEKVVKKYYKRAIVRGDMRAMLECLQQNIPIWYTPDTDAGLRNSVFVPFFGVQAASITATSRLAKLSGAPVITGGYYRRDDLTGYDIEILPMLEDFPSEDIVHDTLRINIAQEQAIRKKPEQYLWQYKRFKTRPPGEPRLYK